MKKKTTEFTDPKLREIHEKDGWILEPRAREIYNKYGISLKDEILEEVNKKYNTNFERPVLKSCKNCKFILPNGCDKDICPDHCFFPEPGDW